MRGLFNQRSKIFRGESAVPPFTVFLHPFDGGIAELGGVGTLEGFRKRGFGTALTSRVAKEAFHRGVDVLFLSTITEEAGRIYEQVGFQFLTRMLFLVDAAHPEGAMVPVSGTQARSALRPPGWQGGRFVLSRARAR